MSGRAPSGHSRRAGSAVDLTIEDGLGRADPGGHDVGARRDGLEPGRPDHLETGPLIGLSTRLPRWVAHHQGREAWELAGEQRPELALHEPLDAHVVGGERVIGEEPPLKIQLVDGGARVQPEVHADDQRPLRQPHRVEAALGHVEVGPEGAVDGEARQGLPELGVDVHVDPVGRLPDGEVGVVILRKILQPVGLDAETARLDVDADVGGRVRQQRLPGGVDVGGIGRAPDVLVLGAVVLDAADAVVELRRIPPDPALQRLEHRRADLAELVDHPERCLE